MGNSDRPMTTNPIPARGLPGANLDGSSRALLRIHIARLSPRTVADSSNEGDAKGSSAKSTAPPWADKKKLGRPDTFRSGMALFRVNAAN